MKVWHFSEMAYHPGWEELGNSLRNVVPSRVYDPKLGADLYHRYLDEWALCDDLGINIMVNEHHDGHLYDVRLHNPDGHSGSRDEERSIAMPWHAHRQPHGCGSGCRGICNDRRHLTRAP